MLEDAQTPGAWGCSTCETDRAAMRPKLSAAALNQATNLPDSYLNRGRKAGLLRLEAQSGASAATRLA